MGWRPNSLITVTKVRSSLVISEVPGEMVVATAIRMAAKKLRPKMEPISLNTSPEQTQTITRTLFDIVKEHGPLSIADIWSRVQEVGLKDLTGKRHMKIILRWMRERQKLKLTCNHVGPHKQFFYTTWFTKPNVQPPKPTRLSSTTLDPKHH